MDPEYRRRLKELFFQAVDLDPEDVDGFLNEHCSDHGMRDEIESLIAAEKRAQDTWLERPAMRRIELDSSADDTCPDPLEGEPSNPFPDWDRYTDLVLVASGGMGDVYRAFDPRLKRQVALKFVRGPDEKHIERFLREAEAQARVEHENVLEVFETGEVEGKLYIAMRFVDGPTLNGTRENTNLEEKVRIMWQVAEAIHAAHREGLVHRDIKPSNILIHHTHDGPMRPFVTDFGIAVDSDAPALTMTGDIVGTPWYMAPERLGLLSTSVDRRTDVYSLGVTMFEYLSGQRPHEAANVVEMISMTGDRDPRRLREAAPGIPIALETIVMKCLEHDPDRRYSSARELADDLRRYLDGEPILAQPPSLRFRIVAGARRHKALVTILLVALLMIFGLAGSEYRARRMAAQREALAREFARRVEQIDDLMRMARVAPAHRLNAEIEVVDQLMDEIRNRLDATGDLGEGSGYYALGRAYLALGQYRRAREKLERAMASGYEAPEVITSLGRVLSQLYRRKLREANRIEDDQRREAEMRRIEIELRRPALDYLRRGGGAREVSTEYIGALRAYLDNDFDAALDLARSGQERLPWLWEAHKLEGDIYYQKGLASLRLGDSAAAREHWKKALSAFNTAASVARSDEESYLRICHLSQSLMELEAPASPALQDFFLLGLKACQTALTIQPDHREAYRLTSNLYCSHAEAAMATNGEARPSLEKASRAANNSAEDVFGFLARGNSWLAEARYEVSKGRDCQASVDSAIAAYERAIESDARSTEARRQLGAAWSLLSANLDNQRESRRAALQRAIEAFESAVKISPEDVRLLNLAGESYCRLAEISDEPDQRSAALTAALRHFENALKVNPGFVGAYLGVARVCLAQLRAKDGLSEVKLQSGLEAAEQALEIRNDDPEARSLRDQLLAITSPG